MKKILRPVLIGFISGATFFGVGAFEIAKVGIPGQESVDGAEVAVAQIASGEPNPFCFDNYSSWYNSTTRKTTADWSTWFVGYYVPSGSTQLRVYNNFERDINGDGLPDYMYIDHNNALGYNRMYDCVYLSNGHGWSKAYQCVAVKPSSTVTYYGDCAQ